MKLVPKETLVLHWWQGETLKFVSKQVHKGQIYAEKR